jgi:hypothetical protein
VALVLVLGLSRERTPRYPDPVTAGPFDLTAYCPPGCPHGHVLRYGGRKDAKFLPNRVLVGFHSCTCATARKGAGSHGHQYVACLQCISEGQPGMMFDPPCSAGG